MNATLFARLVDAIDEWSDKNCEKNHWPDGWVCDSCTNDMAKAAAVVFDMMIKGQKFAKEQESE